MKPVVYLNGKYLPLEEAYISPNDRGFNFADGIYEAIRSYDGYLYQLHAHLQRLKYGLHEMRMTAMDVDYLANVAQQLIIDNDLTKGEALIYLQVTRGAAPRSHKFPPRETEPTIFMSANRFHHPPHEREQGVKVILVPDIRWARCDIKTIGLIPNVLARQQATEQGAAEAIFVRDGVALEGTHCNFGAVIDGELVTAPANNYILSGITRNVVIELCRQFSIPVRETPIYEHQLKEAAELMIIGTTVEITPVIRINDWLVGTERPGKITMKIQKAFGEMVKSNY